MRRFSTAEGDVPPYACDAAGAGNSIAAPVSDHPGEIGLDRCRGAPGAAREVESSSSTDFSLKGLEFVLARAADVPTIALGLEAFP